MKKLIAMLLSFCLTLGCTVATAEQAQTVNLSAQPDIETLVALLGKDEESSEALETVLELLSRMTAVASRTDTEGRVTLLLDGQSLGEFSYLLDAEQNVCLLLNSLAPETVLSCPLNDAADARETLENGDSDEIMQTVQNAALEAGLGDEQARGITETIEQITAQATDESAVKTLDTPFAVEDCTFTQARSISLDAETVTELMAAIPAEDVPNETAQMEQAQPSLVGTLYTNEGSDDAYLDLTVSEAEQPVAYVTALRVGETVKAELLRGDLSDDTLRETLMDGDGEGLYLTIDIDKAAGTFLCHLYTGDADVCVAAEKSESALTANVAILDMDVMTANAEFGTEDFTPVEIAENAQIVPVETIAGASEEQTAAMSQNAQCVVAALLDKIAAIDPELGQKLAALMPKTDAQVLWQGEVVTKSGNGINLWSDSLKSERVCEIPEGAIVNVLGETDAHGFVQAEYDGTTGYCDVAYLQKLD